MTQSRQGPDPAAAPNPTQDRRQFAALLRRARSTVGRAVVQTLSARWGLGDVGIDLADGVVADECVRLVATLAFAIEVNDAGLFEDELAWLNRLFQARGYPSGRYIPGILDAYAQACRAVGPAEGVAQWVTPVLDAARHLTAGDGDPDAEAPPGAAADAC